MSSSLSTGDTPGVAADTNKAYVTEENFGLLWAMIQVKGDSDSTNWGDIARFLNPKVPEKDATIKKRFTDLKDKLAEDLGTLESKGVTPTAKKVARPVSQLRPASLKSTSKFRLISHRGFEHLSNIVG